MARHAVGPRRSDSPRTRIRGTRIVAGVSLLVLFGAIAWDLADDHFWARHTLFTSLVASLIVVAVTAAVLNEVLERRQRERWSVLAQYALFDLVRTARLVWSGLLELAGLVPEGELEDGALAPSSRSPSGRRPASSSRPPHTWRAVRTRSNKAYCASTDQRSRWRRSSTSLSTATVTATTTKLATRLVKSV